MCVFAWLVGLVWFDLFIFPGEEGDMYKNLFQSHCSIRNQILREHMSISFDEQYVFLKFLLFFRLSFRNQEEKSFSKLVEHVKQNSSPKEIQAFHLRTFQKSM